MCLFNNDFFPFTVPRVSFEQNMYNGREGMMVEVCAVLSNEIARQGSVSLTVDNSVAGYDDAESKIMTIAI